MFDYAMAMGLAFQHTAARRRLHVEDMDKVNGVMVSTHSRAEAAAKSTNKKRGLNYVSTHSRAEAAAEKS